MSLFLASELLDFDDDVTTTELIAGRAWGQLARRCCPGMVIAGYLIGFEEAMLLAAHLPDHLRLDWLDGDAHVSKEGFAQ
jgi:hypothetical protein